jgi:membrane protease YdiL (CAAX protease family)
MLIALSSSLLFRLQILPWYKNMVAKSGNYYITCLEAAGPFLGGLVMWFIMGKNIKKMFLGSKPYLSILFLVFPILAFTIVGTKNSLHLNSHLFGFFVSIWILSYGILEETGWRGYLQQEFAHKSQFVKYLLVGTFWYVWHLTFLGKTTLENELAIWLILVAASFGIGSVYKLTQSVFAAACFHIIGNILGLSDFFTNALSFNQRIVIIAPCIVAWIALIIISKNKRYPKEAIYDTKIEFNN